MISPNYTVDYFEVGNEVIYLPGYALNEFSEWVRFDYPDYILNRSKFSKGVISSKNDKFIFVKYYVNGELQSTAQATNPQDLILWKK